MSRVGRGATGVGRPAVLPGGAYQPKPESVDADGSLVVQFTGEDGRAALLRVGALPLPGWHRLLAAAVDRRVGPAGGLRTAASVRAAWGSLGRWMRYLDGLPAPPVEPEALRVAHVEGFLAHRAIDSEYAGRDLRELGQLLKTGPLAEHVPAQVHDFLARRVGRLGQPKPGYSDGELARLVAAARRDVAAIRDRLRAGEQLLARYHDQPDTLGAASLADARLVAETAATGCVPHQPGLSLPVRRLRFARQLFLTMQDLVPLLVLMVAVSGANVETIKELPAEHRILEDRAVEVRLVKRRRGAGQWWRTVTWEIGPASRALHTPGGVYLLVHELTARSRQVLGAGGLWALWRNGYSTGVAGVEEHCDPFAATLGAQVSHPRWVARHALLADAAPGIASTAGPEPLRLDFNRLKTSIDVRRTRQAGGHLPSAARTNTIPVLFRHYLRGDPTVADWAGQVISEAVLDAEQAALTAHRHATAAAGGGPRVVAGPVGQRCHAEHGGHPTGSPAQPAPVDGPWSACVNPQAHPATGRRCEVSFLDCFHCGNCLVTTGHLPRLLGLLDALTARRALLCEADWWARYGATWAAIRHDVLGKFTPAQIEAAAAVKAGDVMLDLVDNPWETP